MEAQLEKELSFHLEQHTSQLIGRGIPPDEARRQARLALGGPEQVKEKCRDARGTRWLEDLPHSLCVGDIGNSHTPPLDDARELQRAAAALVIGGGVSPYVRREYCRADINRIRREH